MSEITRRDFLKNTAIGAAGVASIGLLGACAGSKETDNDNSKGKVTHNPVRTEKCDLVVVGSGTAGLCAAVRAAELGASVILLEKLSSIGGTSVFTEGLAGINSYMNKTMGSGGKPFDVNEVVQRSQEYSHWSGNSNVLQKFVSESGKTIDWLHFDCGIEFLTASVTSPTSYPSWHLSSINGKFEYVGKAVLEPLSDYGKKHGLEIRLLNPATGLIVEDGKVQGVYVQDKKKEEYAIKAKNVILATGGYANNKELFKRFTFLDPDSIWNYGLHEGRDGDGIRWAEDLGASFHLPGAVAFAYPQVIGNKVFGGGVPFLFAMQPILRINERGKRFYNENNAGDFTITCNALKSQHRVFTVLDQKLLEYVHDVGIMVGFEHVVPTGEPFTDAYNVVNEGIEKKQVYKFDTIEQLAEHIGCDVKDLQETLDKYNKACEDGVDAEYGLPAEVLHPMNTAPFYCSELQIAMYCTVGGLNVDENLRVLNTDGEAIPGLFALGCDASSIYGTDYDVGILSGSQQGWCATGGRLAAEFCVGK